MESRSSTFRNLVLGFGGIIAIGLAVWRLIVADRQSKAAQDQAEISQRGLLNERYQRGAEMLGSPVLSVRLGGIYALQRLAEDEPEQYHVEIMRLFSAFAHDPTKKGGDEISLGDSGGQLDIKKSYEDVQGCIRPRGGRTLGRPGWRRLRGVWVPSTCP